MKPIVGKILKVVTFCGLAIAIMYGMDFLSLMDIATYEQTGRMSILLQVSQRPLLILAVMIIIPYLIVTNMRMWKKFE